MTRRTVKRSDTLDAELEQLLAATCTVEEAQEALRDGAADLSKDPDFVADRLKTEIIEELLRAMEREGLNKNQLALRCGKSRQWISRILGEGDNFTVATLARLACALGLRPQIVFAAPSSAPAPRKAKESTVSRKRRENRKAGAKRTVPV